MNQQRGQDIEIKRAPNDFEFDDEDDGDVGDDAYDNNRGQNNKNYMSVGNKTNANPQASANINASANIAPRQQTGGQNQKRSSSAKKRKNSRGQMMNKSYNQSEVSMSQANHNDDPENSKDFNSAYNKLIEKIYQEQGGNNMLVSQDELNRLEHMKGLNEEEFRQRIADFEDKKRRKILNMQDEYKDKDLEGCTFKPQLMAKQTNQQQKRSMEQFLADQSNFQKKVFDKQANMKQKFEHDEFTTLHPVIDSTSRKIIEQKMQNRNEKPTYERLYHLNQERQEKQKERQSQLQPNPHPHSPKNKEKRERPVQDTLYEDAFRRKEETERRKQELAQTAGQQLQQTKFKNEKQDKYVQKKFDKEYRMVLSNLPREHEHEIYDFDEYVAILQTMGFLPMSRHLPPQSQQRLEHMIQELWRFLNGDKRNGVDQDSLRVALMNIIGVRLKDREHQHNEECGHKYQASQKKKQQNEEDEEQSPEKQEELLEEQADKDITSMSFFDEENQRFYVKTGAQKAISHHFKDLYINRVQYVGSVRTYTNQKMEQFEKSQSYNQQPFMGTQAKPQISEKSQKYAAKRRKDMNAHGATLVEILLMPTNKKLDKQEQEKKEREHKEVEQCTFKPQTLDYQGNGVEYEGDRWMYLYNKTAKGAYAEKQMKSKAEYEFERSQEDCTFKPKINEAIAFEADYVSGGANSVNTVKGVDKMMERLNRARQEQLQKKLMTERGMPSQMKAGKPDKVMNFGSNTNKFKSGFGIEGSSLNPKKNSSEQKPKEEVKTEKQQRKVNYIKPKKKKSPKKQEDPKSHRDEEDKEALLYVDVNLGEGQQKRIIIYEGDTAEQLANEFQQQYGISDESKMHLIALLQQEMNKVLGKIHEDHGDEEEQEESDGSEQRRRQEELERKRREQEELEKRRRQQELEEQERLRRQKEEEEEKRRQAQNHAIQIVIVRAELTRDTEMFGQMDPFVVLTYGQKEYKTSVQEDAGKKPVWNETFKIQLEGDYRNQHINLEVLEEDVTTNDVVGSADIPVVELMLTQLDQKVIEIFYKGKSAGKVFIKCVYLGH